MVQEIGEAVPVVARFRGGRFEPLRFKWGGRTLRVVEVTGRWAERDGEYRVYHFAVVTDGDGWCEMSLHTRGMEWRLDRALAGGDEA